MAQLRRHTAACREALDTSRVTHRAGAAARVAPRVALHISMRAAMKSWFERQSGSNCLRGRTIKDTCVRGRRREQHSRGKTSGEACTVQEGLNA